MQRMNGRLNWIAGATLGVILVFSWNPAHAVITAKTPLKAIEGSSVYILVGKVDKFFPEKPGMLVTVGEDIKGKAPFRKLPINLKVVDEKTAKANQIAPVLKRLGPDMEIIFFLSPIENDYITFAFTNGTWFQLHGSTVGKKDEVVFSLKSAEPYFRKSFKGTTEELRKLLKDHAAKKAKLPPLDDKIEPGFGPEYVPKQKSERIRILEVWIALNRSTIYDSRGSLFAVIPTIGLGAPLAILALLFPTIFGGVFVLFRQWLAFITLISLNSTLLLVQWGFVTWLPDGSWWSTPAAVWFLMSVFTFVCAFWAWRRQLNALSNGDVEAPPKTELAVLAFMTASCIVTTLIMWYVTPSIRWSDIGWTLTVVLTLGILAGTAYRGWSAFQKPAPFGSMPLATEGVILGAMLLGHVAFVPAIFGGKISTSGKGEGKEQTGTIEAKIAPVKEKWVYAAGENIFGMFASTPLVDGDAIYTSYSTALQRATVIRLDRQTGNQKWAFAKFDLRQMISSPCLADGKLYFGEGFHDDTNCNVYCIDADSGKQIWRFKTEGQTESSPTVAHGKVYIGAGNVGVYCLDAKDGAVIWKYPADDASVRTRVAYNRRLLRFGGGMVVVGNRLYCGSGVDRNKKGPDEDKGETASFCLDAATGKLIWKTAAPYPVWSTPVIKDGMVYVTSGNGDVFSDAPLPEKKGGALQCLDAETGKEQWSIKLDNGVIEAPAVDAHRIYFGCRDGYIYCVSRADGKQRWRYFLESPIIATPVLDSDPVYERTVSVFTLSTAGKVCCMNPQTGDIIWRFDLTDKRAAISTSPRLVVTRTADGYTRHLYFGCGLGGGADIYDNRPVFYCLEDKVNVE
jgi:outer membrane protein assembly factor BamB